MSAGVFFLTAKLDHRTIPIIDQKEFRSGYSIRGRIEAKMPAVINGTLFAGYAGGVGLRKWR